MVEHDETSERQHPSFEGFTFITSKENNVGNGQTDYYQDPRSEQFYKIDNDALHPKPELTHITEVVQSLTPLLALPNQDSQHHMEYFISEATGQPYRFDETSVHNYSTGENDYDSKLVPVNKKEVKYDLLDLASMNGAENISPKTLDLMEKFDIISLKDGQIDPKDITAFKIQSRADVENHEFTIRAIHERHAEAIAKNEELGLTVTPQFKDSVEEALVGIPESPTSMSQAFRNAANKQLSGV